MVNQTQDAENKEKEEKASSPESLVAVFKHCARIYDEIEKMDRKHLMEKLEYYGLDTEGNVDSLKQRLKRSYRRFKSSDIDVDIKSPKFPYYVVIDFEATCVGTNQQDYPHEIIEFPGVLVNSDTLEVEDTFQMYCKPVINPKLSDFCIELTGITQDQVDAAESFGTVFQLFEKWLRKHKLMQKDKFAVVADTPWDMSRFLFQQCLYSGISFPIWAKKWVNIKTTFRQFYKARSRSFRRMLRFFGMECEGRLHCGLDDAKNIARIVIQMIRDGADMSFNESIVMPRNFSHYHKSIPRGITDQQKKGDGGGSSWREKVDYQPVRANFRDISLRKNTYARKMQEKDEIIMKMEKEFMESCTEKESREPDHPLEWLPKELVKECQMV